MDITFPTHMVWWVSMIDIPVTATIFGLLWRAKLNHESAILELHRLLETRNAQLRDSLAAYKLEVAKSYTSISDARELEGRLVSHLLRIESKLDRRTELTGKDF